MAEGKGIVDLSGLFKAVPKSIDRLTPLYEAVSNSIESILLRGDAESLDITITIVKLGLDENDKVFDGYIISDTGIGFNDANFERFNEVYNRSKGYKNRGSGRLQLIHNFELVRVTSDFLENGELKRRAFRSSKKQLSDNSNYTDSDAEVTGTTVELARTTARETEVQILSSYSAEDFKQHLLNKFLLRLHRLRTSDSIVPAFEIIETWKGKKQSSASLTADDLAKPVESGTFSLEAEKPVEHTDGKRTLEKVFTRTTELIWEQFEVPSSSHSTNCAYLCSKGMRVQAISIDGVGQKEDFDGKRYATMISGQLLDEPESVSHNLDRLILPTKDSILNSSFDFFEDTEETFFTIENLLEESKAEIDEAYSHLIKAKEDRRGDAQNLALTFGIPIRFASRIDVEVSDTDERIVSKLYEAQSKDMSKKAIRARRILESLKDIDPTGEEYQEQLRRKARQLNSLISVQDKDELAKYIVRREMIIDLLDMINAGEVSPQPSPGKTRLDKEGLVHDLIFKRNKRQTREDSDLWLLDENFVHFTAASNKSLWRLEDASGNRILREPTKDEKIKFKLKTSLTPDIFLFTEEEQCIIVELKAADKEVSDYQNQLARYARIIANYSKASVYNFHLYLIGGDIDPFGVENVRPTHYGSLISGPTEIRGVPDHTKVVGNYTMEIMTFEVLASRARKRNQAFAERLGLKFLKSDSSVS